MSMKIATTRLADPGDDWHGPIVEITTDDHITLVVNLPLAPSQAESDPVDRALGALSDLSSAAGDERARRAGNDAKASARSAQDQAELDDQLNAGWRIPSLQATRWQRSSRLPCRNGPIRARERGTSSFRYRKAQENPAGSIRRVFVSSDGDDG